MSKNIIPTIGQHVFIYDPPKYTEKGVPVLAKNPTQKEEEEARRHKKKLKYQFLGEGYYFWDDNIRRALDWGTSHCNNKFLILETPLTLRGDHFLDLVGSRADLNLFMQAFEEIRIMNPNLTIGIFCKTMQKMAKYQPDKWPYRIVRGLNVKSTSPRIQFNQIIDSKMLLDPEIIICFYDLNDITLSDSYYLDQNQNRWTLKKS